MEQTIKMAAKLYECRDTVKGLYKEDFHNKISWYKQTLEAIMKQDKTNAIKAVLKVSETKTYQENGVAQLMFLAAATEIMEPSK